MSNANIELVQSFYESFGHGDLVTLADKMMADIDWTVNGRQQDYPLFGSRKGADNVERFCKQVDDTEKFTTFSPKEFHATGDLVFAIGHYAGSLKKTGRPFDCDWVHIFTIKNGKVAAFREFTDTAQFAEAFRG
ncbi:MAG: nuclear transport factor 2 family protein [Xanthobacteraceae bacterium]